MRPHTEGHSANAASFLTSGVPLSLRVPLSLSRLLGGCTCKLCDLFAFEALRDSISLNK